MVKKIYFNVAAVKAKFAHWQKTVYKLKDYSKMFCPYPKTVKNNFLFKRYRNL